MASIGGMGDSVVDLDIGDFERVDSFQATDIETVFLGVGSPLMMCVDPADCAEEMSRNLRIEPILSQILMACDDCQTGQWNRRNNCPFPLTNGAIAMSGLLDSVRQFQFKDHAAAVAGSAVRICNFDSIDLVNHWTRTPS